MARACLLKCNWVVTNSPLHPPIKWNQPSGLWTYTIIFNSNFLEFALKPEHPPALFAFLYDAVSATRYYSLDLPFQVNAVDELAEVLAALDMLRHRLVALYRTALMAP